MVLHFGAQVSNFKPILVEQVPRRRLPILRDASRAATRERSGARAWSDSRHPASAVATVACGCRNTANAKRVSDGLKGDAPTVCVLLLWRTGLDSTAVPLLAPRSRPPAAQCLPAGAARRCTISQQARRARSVLHVASSQAALDSIRLCATPLFSSSSLLLLLSPLLSPARSLLVRSAPRASRHRAPPFYAGVASRLRRRREAHPVGSEVVHGEVL